MDEAGPSKKSGRARNLRTKRAADSDDEQPAQDGGQQPAVEVHKDKLEELKLLQKLRKKTGGTAASQLAAGVQDDFLQPKQPIASTSNADNDIMGGFSKAKTVVTSEEDPNMQKFIEQELAKRLGKQVGSEEQEDPEAKRRRLEAEMYKIPEEYKTNMAQEVVIPGLNTVITEVALPASVRLRNIEETEAMKRRLLGGDVDEEVDDGQPGRMRRGLLPSTFGRPQARHGTREDAEDEDRRMKYVSERRPALPKHKMGR